ncbi:hypothetical protein F5B21DRAFT_413436 [Xylaria acuta]|nr:hypothetical protein F5B21DRAFT_413436 [Xylaria acuta]
MISDTPSDDDLPEMGWTGGGGGAAANGTYLFSTIPHTSISPVCYETCDELGLRFDELAILQRPACGLYYDPRSSFTGRAGCSCESRCSFDSRGDFVLSPLGYGSRALEYSERSAIVTHVWVAGLVKSG